MLLLLYVIYVIRAETDPSQRIIVGLPAFPPGGVNASRREHKRTDDYSLYLQTATTVFRVPSTVRLKILCSVIALVTIGHIRKRPTRLRCMLWIGYHNNNEDTVSNPALVGFQYSYRSIHYPTKAKINSSSHMSTEMDKGWLSEQNDMLSKVCKYENRS